jgi:hypothetical protein
MKVMVLNNSGNVGKSFLSRELFYFNMLQQNECDDVALIEVETHNSANSKFNIETIKISGKELNTMYKQLLMNDCVITDVGASNIVNLFQTLAKNDVNDIIDEFDYFIVPVVPNAKIEDDTLKVILALTSINVPKEKIKIIFNNVDDINRMNDFIQKAKEFVDINKNLIIQSFDYTNEIEKMGITINQLANSDKDYKALAKESYKKGDTDLGDKYADLSLMKGSAKAITKKMQELFEYLKK